jgi:hypothetical protein
MAMTQFGDEEVWAQACIEEALPEAMVEQHDDGSSSSMYDLTITYPGGSTDAVEITTAADPKYVELAKALDKKVRHWQVQGLRGTWWVRVLPSARAGELRQQLPGILRGLESDDVREIRGNRSSPQALVATLGRLGVVAASQAVANHEGRVFVMAEAAPERMGGTHQPRETLWLPGLGSGWPNRLDPIISKSSLLQALVSSTYLS